MTNRNDAAKAGDSPAAESGDAGLGGLAGEVANAFEHLGESKAGRKISKKASKAEKKSQKKQTKQTKKECKKLCSAGVSAEALSAAAAHGGADGGAQPEYRVTPNRARNVVSVARVVVPAALPVLAPVAVRAAGAAREAYDQYRARKLGVDVERLAEYSGHGAGLHARIAGVSDGLVSLRDSGNSGESGSGDQAEFIQSSQDTLRQLSATVRAAERMPGVRRKSAHRAVSGELDQLESELLRRLGT